MSSERKNQDEVLDDYVDDNIVTLMERYNLDRDTAEEVHDIMTDLDVEAIDALEIFRATEQGGGEPA